MDPLDQNVLHWFQAEHAPGLNLVMVNLSDLGHRYVVTVVALVALLCFLVRGRLRTAVLILAATLAAWGLIEGIKRVVERPRPANVERVSPSVLARALGTRGKAPPGGGLPQPTKAEASYSFPSGHALASTAIYGTIALMVARRLRRRWARWLVVAGTGLLLLVIGVTRLYLGAHYFTDVLAGWALGLACALFFGWLDARWAAPHAPPAVTGPGTMAGV